MVKLQHAYRVPKPVVHAKFDDIVWVQTQAPAGNWVDTTGCHGPEALEHARELMCWHSRVEKRSARIVRKAIEVLDASIYVEEKS